MLKKWKTYPVSSLQARIQIIHKIYTRLVMAEDLSFHKIWLKSVNNFSRYPADKHQIDRQTERQKDSATAVQPRNFVSRNAEVIK